MLCPRIAVGALALSLLAGCATVPPAASRGHAPNWSLEPASPVEASRNLNRERAGAQTETRPPADTGTSRNGAFAGTWVPLLRWCQAAGVTVTPSQVQSGFEFVLRSRCGALTLRPGTRLVRWGGHDVHLGFAPLLINEEPFLHKLDLEKTVAPLLEGDSARAATAKGVVILDPGHGGQDAGTKSIAVGCDEKEYTLDWARRTGELLARAGLRVVLTRTNDMDLSISNRVAFANRQNGALFLSLHFNAAGPIGEQAGVETYCLTPAGLPSNLTRGYDDDPGLTFPNNAFDAQNLHLAVRVHEALLRVNGNRDRGVRRARFLSVLRGQERPAALVEGGYLSDPTEAQQIATPAHRQQLAEALASAILAYLSSDAEVGASANRHADDATTAAAP